jgi:hypothetical protein
MVFEVKAHMIVKESETWGVMERLLPPLPKALGGLPSLSKSILSSLSLV